jgi:hypothetical protein
VVLSTIVVFALLVYCVAQIIRRIVEGVVEFVRLVKLVKQSLHTDKQPAPRLRVIEGGKK